MMLFRFTRIGKMPLAALFALALASYAYAWEVPTVIDFQGKLMDNNNNPQAGSFNMTFRIYNQSSGGALLWQENKLVTVTNGLFSTLLGSVNAINLTFGEDYYVEMVVSGETFSPRYRVATAPYAFRANITTTAIAGTTTEPSFVVNSISGQASNLTEWRSSSGTVLAAFNVSGNLNLFRNLTISSTGLFFDATLNLLGIGTATPSALLQIAGTFSTNNLSLNVNNTLYVNASASRVGIGTSSPNQQLQLTGNINVSSGNIWVTGDIISNGTPIVPVTNVSILYGANQSDANQIIPARISTLGSLLVAIDEGLGTGWSASAGLVFLQTASDRVGIGTATPSSKLDILGVNTANNLSLNVNNTLYLNDSGGGMVGVRTASPTSALHVVGNASISGTLLVNGVNISGGQSSDNSTLTALLGQKLNLTGGTLSGLLTINGNPSNTGNLSLSVNSTLYVNQSTSSVGIGTASPAGLLQIVSAVNPVFRVTDSTSPVTAAVYTAGDTDTYFGSLTNHPVNFIVNDVPRMYISTNGNVGINTTSPAAALHVNGSGGDDQIRVTTTTSSLHAFLRSGNSAGTVTSFFGATRNSADSALRANTIVAGSRESSDFDLITNYTPRLTINGSSGSVGIGTTSPTGALLHIYEDSGNAYQKIETDALGTAALYLDAPDGYYSRIWFQEAGATNWLIDADHSGTADKLYISDDDGAVRLTIQQDGNVGIGTTSPQYPLNVNGTTRDMAEIRSNNSQGTALYLTSTANNNQYYMQSKIQGGNSFFAIGDMVGDRLVIMNNTGNVGIGTTAPKQKLDVNGNVNASAYITNGTDYAEMLEKFYPDEKIEAGDVVAVVDRKVTKKFTSTSTGDSFLVMTGSAGVLGNNGVNGVPVAFIGQVKVKVKGAAEKGDYVLAYESGYAVSKSKANVTFDEYKERVIGTAWESKENAGSGKILVAVGVK